MTEPPAPSAPIADLVVAQRPWSTQPLAWFRLGPGDVALVQPDRRITLDAPLFERASGGLRDTAREEVTSPVAGTVEVVQPGAIGVRADGTALRGAAFVGEAVRGRLVLGVRRRDDELRRAIDVGAAGAILVAGARIESETLTRARAIGVRGIVTGGIAGRDLRTFLASEARQQAGLHPAVAFALLVLDGYGRRPIPGPIWTWLTQQQGGDVALVQEPPMLVAEPAASLAAVPTEHVRVVGGPALGREGRLVELVGSWRGRGGVYQPNARVELLPVPPDLPGEVQVLPLADLERFE